MRTSPFNQPMRDMRSSSRERSSPSLKQAYTWDSRVAVIRKELVALTGDSDIAVVLNQLLYWSQRVKDYDLLLEEEKSIPYQESLLEEERQEDKCIEEELDSCSFAQHGWFYKKTPELIEETLLCVSRVTMRRYLNALLERGWIQERGNSQYKWDRTTHYRVNLNQLDKDLKAIGYGLPGFILEEDVIGIDENRQKNSMLKNEPSIVQNLTLECKDKDSSLPLTDENWQKSSMSKIEPSMVQNLTPECKDNDSSLPLTDENWQKSSMSKIEPSMVQNLTLECKDNDSSLPLTDENWQKSSMSKIEPSMVQNLTLECKDNDSSLPLTDENWQKSSMSKIEPSMVQNLTLECKDNDPSLLLTDENWQKSSISKIEPSMVQNLTLECKESEHSNVKKCTFITENKTENIKKEHRTGARTGAYTREAEVDDASDREQEVISPTAKVAALMVDLWRRHVNPETIFLTDERKRRLESLLELHFQADLRVWESFCLRVKAVPFLMGGGKQKWHVTLDWVLAKGNLLKVLEGNYDNSGRMEHQKNEPSKGVQDREIRALLDSIQDSFWKNWCSQLMGIHPITDGPLMDGDQPIEALLTVYELKQITEARFMEFDGRLVWIECFDEKTLSKIEDLRFKISPVARATFPEAKAVRGHLHQPQFIQ